jgi:hypothetical protein
VRFRDLFPVPSPYTTVDTNSNRSSRSNRIDNGNPDENLYSERLMIVSVIHIIHFYLLLF